MIWSAVVYTGLVRCGVYGKEPFSVPPGSATVFYSLSGPEITPSDRDFGTPEHRENIVGAKCLLLMLSTASATGIAMCHLAVALEQQRESAYG